MKGAISTPCRLFVVSLLVLLIPVTTLAENPQPSKGLPPVDQVLIREGTVATQLKAALNPGSVNSNEAEAESWLGDKGVSPKNGWIADYPVTPAIMGELHDTLGNAADSHNIPLSRDEALKLLDSITRELAVVSTTPGDSGSGTAAPEGENLVAPTAVYDYYTEEGPPVVTYYAPPSDYDYLYSWVPYPFWCGGFSFGGFFILNDFQRAVFVDHDHGHDHREFVSNHFRDRITNRLVRVDSGIRLSGRFSGNSGAFARRSPVTSGAPGTIRPSFTSRRMQPSPASMRSGSPRSASFQGMRGQPEGVGATRQTGGGANVSRSFSSSGRSFVSATSPMSSFRSGFGGGFSRQGGGGSSGGHGRR